jgi:excisionase family DNA binding protein
MNELPSKEEEKILPMDNPERGSAMPKLLNIRDLSTVLRVAEITVRRLIKSRVIPYHRIGKKYFFTADDVSTYLSRVAHPIIEGNE